MTIRLVVIAAITLASTVAVASPEKRSERRFAVGSTAVIGRSVGGSLYVAVDRHVAIRVNAAAYKFQANPGVRLAVGLLSGDDDEMENHREGGFLDGGASLVLFPRRVLDGPTFEIGALVRYQDWYLKDWRDVTTTRESVTVAGRTMVGWTWTIGRTYFVSMAVGVSRGYSSGAGITQPYHDHHWDDELVPYRIGGWETRFECYTRIGFAFGDAI